MELARQLLHAQVTGKAGQVQPFDAAIERGTQRAIEQGRSDPVALPVFFDAQRNLGGARCKKAQLAVDEKTVDDRVSQRRPFRVAADVCVCHRAAEPAAPTIGIEAQQVGTMERRLVDRKFANRSAADQVLVYWRSPGILAPANLA